MGASPDADDLLAGRRAGDDALAELGDLEEAGGLAVQAGDAAGLAAVLRRALAVQPPRVGADALRRWHAAAVFGPGDPHAWWLDGACRALHGGASDEVIGRYQAARRAFAEVGDTEAEIAVGLALGIAARRANDLTALAELVGRSRSIAQNGDPRSHAITLLGDALVRQLSGDPAGAVKVLDQVPSHVLEGDWAAQLAMMRGTNLMLCGRLAEAGAHLDEALGAGSAWSSATALRLVALVRWLSGQRGRALDDLDEAARQARALGAVSIADECLALHAAMASLMGRPDATSLHAAASRGAGLDDKARIVLDLARVAIAVADDDLDAAVALAEHLPTPAHASPPDHWTIGLLGALVPERSDDLAAAAAAQPALLPAWRAGRAARATLEGGPLAPAQHLPFLPARWCALVEPELRIDLLGTAVVYADGRPVEHPYWERSRVRELCLYLVLGGNGPRTLAADRLWPDLAGPAATRNLRVTLANLLDVLDPDRQKGAGSTLVEERHGALAFVDSDRLVIDVREEVRDAETVVAASAVGDDARAMAAARRLARRPGGPLLGGGRIGGWVDDAERGWRDLVLRAIAIAAPRALVVGDAALAETLARRGLADDRWAERLHQVLVRARLQNDDLDGARRAMRDALGVLAELSVAPESATVHLAETLGVSIAPRPRPSVR